MPSRILTISLTHRSLLPVQILTVAVCVFCISYFLLSNSSPFFVKNINIKTWTLIPYTNSTKLFIADHEKQELRSVFRTENKSFICDRPRKSDGTRDTNVSTPLEDHFVNILGPYCGIVPTPRKNWVPASRYTESDIVFIIYTGASFYHTRATAVRDTWLSRVSHKYFFSGTPYPSLPVTVINGTGEDYLSNIKKLYHGMQVAYKEHNTTAKFYYLAGCDTFVNVPHILKRLDAFDHQQPSIIGGYAYQYRCFINRTLASYNVTYPSGGAGFFLSAQMMKMMQPKLNSYFENDWPITEDRAFSDVALNCLAFSMGVKPSFVPGFWAFNPEQTLKDSGREQLHADIEPNTFHYVHPLSMYTLDEFYVYQLLDRLGNDRNLNELMKFTTKFVAAHYELLRVKRGECTLPTVKARRRRR